MERVSGRKHRTVLLGLETLSKELKSISEHREPLRGLIQESQLSLIIPVLHVKTPKFNAMKPLAKGCPDRKAWLHISQPLTQVHHTHKPGPTLRLTERAIKNARQCNSYFFILGGGDERN